MITKDKMGSHSSFRSSDDDMRFRTRSSPASAWPIWLLEHNHAYLTQKDWTFFV